jgi:hypothetical protein
VERRSSYERNSSESGLCKISAKFFHGAKSAMEQLDLEKANSENLPTCRVCGKPMKLVDEGEQRWYCLKDDQVWLGKEQRWL